MTQVPADTSVDARPVEAPPVEARPADVRADRTWQDAADAHPDGVVESGPLQIPGTGGGRDHLRAALEAVLLVVDEPVSDLLLAQTLQCPRDEVVATLEELAAEYTADKRGFDLRRAAGGWRFYTRDAYAPHVERFVLEGQSARLTQASLETLAVVAYKQPVSRARVSAIRGVAVDGVIRTLATRGLIEECGTDPETGAHLYRTTTLFLEKLGLDSLDELPLLAPLLPEMDSLDDVIATS